MSEMRQGEPDRPATGDDPGNRARSNHLVITVHGIRTYGNWQDDLARLLEASEPGIRVRNFHYGYFSAIAFLLPFLRWIVARRFRKFLVHEIRWMPPGARIDVVAHSFGTYLVASALGSIPADRQIHTIVFAGSVLRPSFPWYKHQESGRLGRVVNECGWDDSVLLLCQFTALMLGMAGRVGFQAMLGENFLNRYYRGSHGLYFDREHRFMRTRWMPVLTTDASIEPVDERPTLTPWEGVKLFVLNNVQFIKVAAAAMIALAIVLIPIDWISKANFKRRVERVAHIAMLANAEQIPGRDPSHVRELLQVDARAVDSKDSDEKSLLHILGSDALDPEDANAVPDDEDRIRWWERLPGMRDTSREAYLARKKHAQANHQLAAGKTGRARDLSKAKLRFEEAIEAYKRVNEQDPTYGSYALCLIDYGLLLTEMGLYDRSIEQFRKVRTDAFPPIVNGKGLRMPPSLAVDSLCYEAEALKQKEAWADAERRLLEAQQIAEDDKERLSAGDRNELLSLVFNNIAWLRMERLDVAGARKYFLLARAACEDLVDRGRFVFKTRLYHVRHGLAMTERLRGKGHESYAQYEQIVAELRELMQNDLLFTPKERRDLRERLVNSMERRADVWLFARESPEFFAPDRDVDRAEMTPAAYRKTLTRVEKNYEDALRYVAQDDPNTRYTLIYKKVIAHCLAAISEMPRVPAPDLEPIDVEFAEAERGYETLNPDLRGGLKIYREIASCCMKLRRPGTTVEDGTDPLASRPNARAASELRALTIEYARRCEALKREAVEMLLVALEILLEPGIADENPEVVALDASRMLSVLGATTKVASHEELQPYVARFNRIAHDRLVARAATKDAPKPGRHDAPSAASPAEPSVLFYVRLSPTRALMVTDGPESAPRLRAAPPILVASPGGAGGEPGRDRAITHEVMKPVPSATAPRATAFEK